MLANQNRKAGIVLALAAFGMLSIGATANAQDELELNSYRIETNDCPGCATPTIYTEQDAINYFADLRATLADGKGGNGYGKFMHNDDDQPQVVFVDFDAGGLPTFPVCNVDDEGAPLGVFGIFLDHVYTQAERKAILKRIRADYDEYDYKITNKKPSKGAYTTLFVGQNDAPLDCSLGSNISVTETGGVSILFGRADRIDFRNEFKDDNAFADASFWEFLIQLDPSGSLFELFSGISIVEFGGDAVAAVSFAVTNQTSNTGAHEVGHLQGLRHQNSFGPPGSGLPDTGAILPEEFVPVFGGPQSASETVLHTMASGASVGLSLQGSTITDRFFSERSTARIAFTEDGRSISEARVRRNGRDKINLEELVVENTIELGDNAGADFKVKALTIDGSISVPGEVDSYTFKGEAGTMVNIELVSVIGRDLSFVDGILGQVRLFQQNMDGSETLIASNPQSFESVFDAEIFDAMLWDNGKYRIEVSAPDEFFPFAPPFTQEPFPISAAGVPELLFGEYSVFVYTFAADFDDD